MAAADQDRADLARSTFEWMTGGEGLDRVDLAHVMEFAWYALPLKWRVPLDEHIAVVDAAGELFERLGLDRYAEVFRSSETRAILDTYQRSEQEGFEAFRAAYERSGIDPPDLDDFAWGGVMGLEEATSREAASRALETRSPGPDRPLRWESLSTPEWRFTRRHSFSGATGNGPSPRRSLDRAR